MQALAAATHRMRTSASGGVVVAVRLAPIAIAPCCPQSPCHSTPLVFEKVSILPCESSTHVFATGSLEKGLCTLLRI